MVVDKETKTFRYTPEYYVLKHVSHYVQPGAKVLALAGTCEEAMGFLNPDGKVVLVLANKGDAPKTVEVSPASRTFTLPAQSINTIVL